MSLQGRPPHIIQGKRKLVTQLYEEGFNATRIRGILKDDYGFDISRQTLHTYMSKWGLPFRHGRTHDTPELRHQIRMYFFHQQLSDEQMHAFLVQDGYKISKRTLTAIRRELGLYRRKTPEQKQVEAINTLAFFDQQSHSSILFPRLTRRRLFIHLSQQAGIHLPMHLAFDMLKQNYPDWVDLRYQALRKRRSGFTNPGPHYTWSIDGYCKLRDFGFEVYGAIDAYSREIQWLYIGHNGLTARAVLAQYIKTIKTKGFMPMAIRSDKGVETFLIAMAHWWLSVASTSKRKVRPRRDREAGIIWNTPQPEDMQREDLSWNEDHENPSQGLRSQYKSEEWQLPLQDPPIAPTFDDVYKFGTSTKNQRIESWWMQLSKGRCHFWRVSLY